MFLKVSDAPVSQRRQPVPRETVGVSDRRTASVLFALGSATEDTELVALRIGEDQPAAPIVLPEIVDRRRTEAHDTFDLVIAGTVGRLQVEMNPVLDLLALRHFDEEEPRLPSGSNDHALLVPGLIRIARDVGEPEHVPPERRVAKASRQSNVVCEIRETMSPW
jgi:hypothetical protein